LATGLVTTAEASSDPAAGTLSRPRMLVAATPTTSRHVKARIVKVRVKQVSASIDDHGHIAENWALIMA
jgi:hypothetical protein